MPFVAEAVDLAVEERLRPPTLPGGVGEVALVVAPDLGVRPSTGELSGPFLDGGLLLSLGLSDRVELSVDADALMWVPLALEDGPDLRVAVRAYDGPRWDLAPAVTVPLETTSGPPFGDLPVPAGVTLDLATRLLPGDGPWFVDLGDDLVRIDTFRTGLDTLPVDYDLFFTVVAAVGCQLREHVALSLDLVALHVEGYGGPDEGRQWSAGALPVGVSLQLSPRTVPWGDLVVRLAVDDGVDTFDYVHQRVDLVFRGRTHFTNRPPR